MDTTLTTASMKRVASAKSRDHSAPRRAYLDTYARRRAGLSDVAPSVVEEAAVPAPTVVNSVAMPFHAPVAVTETPPSTPVVPTLPPAVTPVTAEFATAPVQVSNTATQQVSIAPVVSDTVEPIVYQPAVYADPAPQLSTDHRNYLESLAKRHMAAIAEAPSSEETVFDFPLQQETDSLFEDIQHNQKLEANLRALYDEPLTDQIAKNEKSASAAHIRTIVASALACGVLAVGIFSFVTSYDSTTAVAQPVGAPVIEVEAPTQQPTGGKPLSTNQSTAPQVNPEHPVRLVMSSIGVNAPIEGLGTTADGLIAVPQAYGVVGWYNKGVVPGKEGPAVLVGHYTAGAGGVFDKLKDAKDGDLITVTNGRGQSFTYKVTKMTEYEKDKVPMAELFKKGNGSRLEIITCAGKWQVNNYDKRLVITAELVQ